MTNIETSLTRLAPQDFEELEVKWRRLEADSSPSFFTSWTWIGCAADRRMTAPVLLEARADGRVAALALFNHAGRWPSRQTLWLAESGSVAHDDIYIEHNGILIARDAPPGILRGCLAACLRTPIDGLQRQGGRRLVFSGVDAELATEFNDVGGDVLIRKSAIAPRVEFGTPASPYLAGLSANTRYQIRRSERQYARRGPLMIDRASDTATAHRYLGELATLHQRYWIGRKRSGAFVNPAFTSFHHELVARGMPRDEIDLLRITAGDHVIGYLYNFRHRGRVSAYQSGFDYAAATSHEKPGLTCHHLAIESYLRQGCVAYDFLAGGDRYKTSLANASGNLVWLDVVPTKTALAHARAARGRIIGVARTLADRVGRYTRKKVVSDVEGD